MPLWTRAIILPETPCRSDADSVENGGSLADRGKPAERSVEDLTKSPSGSGSYGMSRAARALTVR